MQDIKIFEDSDRFWDLFWQRIDKAEKIVFVTTYDMDHKMVAAITLEKMLRAQQRGCQTVLVIDDLNFYASREGMQKLKDAGGIVIKNNPFSVAWQFLFSRETRHKFFNRNHQKAMLVDDCIFCGSLNIADPYTGTRYGDNSFRDLNCFIKSGDTKKVRDFFYEILKCNED